mmetsp:Transcript_47659/g.62993  ORF Transcript_47659/g.62993 Transcript_47659/m.62993 type:complete len:107 (+) Transcript_47659:532-852(+)
MKSPVFEQGGCIHENSETIYFKNIAEIRQVSASEEDHVNAGGCIRRLGFKDRAGREVEAYDPNARGASVSDTTYNLGRGEEIIGVYGAYSDLFGHFSSFGFIVKVK